jgi:hypothetical protein
MAEVLKRYRGSSNEYTDIATRGGEVMGLGIQYAIHPGSGIGHILVRFVAHGDGQFEPFKHFQLRAHAQFKDLADGGKSFVGVRLNKLAIPVFSPAPIINDVVAFGDKLGVWVSLTDWITDQLVADGFVPILNILDYIKAELGGIAVPFEQVKLVIEFPDLAAAKKSAASYASSHKASHDDDDGDEDEEQDDEDEDDDGDTIN